MRLSSSPAVSACVSSGVSGTSLWPASVAFSGSPALLAPSSPCRSQAETITTTTASSTWPLVTPSMLPATCAAGLVGACSPGPVCCFGGWKHLLSMWSGVGEIRAESILEGRGFSTPGRTRSMQRPHGDCEGVARVSLSLAKPNYLRLIPSLSPRATVRPLVNMASSASTPASASVAVEYCGR